MRRFIFPPCKRGKEDTAQKDGAMALFEFDCPQCRKRVALDDQYCGKVVACPHCDKGVVVPKKMSGSGQQLPEPRSNLEQKTKEKTIRSKLYRVKCPHCSSPYDIEKCDLHKDALCEDCGKLFVAELDNDVHPVKPVAEILKSPIIPMRDTTSVAKPSFVRPTVAIRSASVQSELQEGKPQNHHPVPIGASCAATMTPVVWYAIAALDVFMIIAVVYLMVSMAGLERRYSAATDCVADAKEDLSRKVEQLVNEADERILESVKALVKESIKLQTAQLEAQSENVQTNFANVRRDIDAIRRRFAQIEKSAVTMPQVSNRVSDARYDDLLKRIEELSRQTGGIAVSQERLAARTASLAEHQNANQQIEDAPKTNSIDVAVQQQDPNVSKPPKMSHEELAQRLKENQTEINRLIAANPGCVLVPSDKQARILETRFAEKRHRRYCLKDKITYVREDYRCTHCNSEISLGDANEACCEVSAKRSFALWRGKRLEADETSRINARIDQLRGENMVIRNGGQPNVAKCESAETQMEERSIVERRTNPVPVGEQYNEGEEPRDLSKMSTEELTRQYKLNLAEIKRLRESNPGCMLVPSHKQARILETRFATKNQRWYCNKEQVTYVRDMFRCTHCKREFGIASDNAKIGCCEVSRKQSFKKWSTGVKEAQKTVEINDRIEKLFKQNAEIKKAVQQQSH